MQIKVIPSSISGTVTIPASKSMTHRAIICASLAQGTSRIDNITYSKDIDATISCMEALGASIQTFPTHCIVNGCNITHISTDTTLDCGESGSTMRFLIPLAAITKAQITMKGHGRLLQRPMNVYHKIFDEQGLTLKQNGALKVKGPLHSDTFYIQGNISSQFITGLMLALPLLDDDSTLEIIPPFESKSYVDLTVQMLETFGIKILEEDTTRYRIPGNQSYQAGNITIEGDYSQLAFFAVLGAIQNKLTVQNADPSSRQGDRVILDFIQKAGSDIRVSNAIEIRSAPLKATTIDIADCPDLGPILCVLASFSSGTTHIIHAKRLRMKESDRIEAMETELKKWGVQIVSTDDTITITGKDAYPRIHGEINGHNDHRIVMAMTVFGLCAQSECIINDAQSITKSYPAFFEDIRRLGGKVEEL